MSVLVIGVALTIAAVALVVLLRSSMMRGVDSRARLRLQDLVAASQRGALPTTLGGTDEDGTVAQLVVNGRVTARSPVVSADERLARFVPPARQTTVRTVHHAPIRDASSAQRVAATRVDTPDGPGVAYVAASIEPVTDSIRTLELLLASAVPGLLVLVGATTWWLVGRTLEPVEAIRRQVAEVSVTELGRRVPEPHSTDEVRRLAQTMNSMLARLDEATTSQRAFVADAAHELRSPLAALRAELDIAARHADSADWPAFLERVSATARRLERLVEDLLALAVAEERGIERRAEVDLDDVVMGQLQALQSTSRLRVDSQAVGPARVLGDRDQLEQVVVNLLDNAARHATTTLAVTLRQSDGVVELAVLDDGPGVPPESRDRVFERFGRVDEARDRRGGGAGLGLAITKRIVDVHGGSIEIDNVPAGTCFVVRLPAGFDEG